MSNKRRKEMFKESKSVKQRYATRKLKVGMVSLLMGFTFIFASAPAAKVIGVPMTVSAEEVDSEDPLKSKKDDAVGAISDLTNLNTAQKETLTNKVKAETEDTVIDEVSTEAKNLDGKMESLKELVTKNANMKTSEKYTSAGESARDSYDRAKSDADTIVSENGPDTDIAGVDSAIENLNTAVENLKPEDPLKSKKDDAVGAISDLTNLNTAQKETLTNKVKAETEDTVIDEVSTEAKNLDGKMESLKELVTKNANMKTSEKYTSAGESARDSYDRAKSDADTIVSENGPDTDIAGVDSAIENLNTAVENLKPEDPLKSKKDDAVGAISDLTNLNTAQKTAIENKVNAAEETTIIDTIVSDAKNLDTAIGSLKTDIAQKSTVESGDAYKYATEDKKNGYDTALIKAEEVVGEANATADTVTTAQEALEDAQKALDGVTVKDDAESTITGLPNLNEDQKSALKGQLGDAVDNAGLNKIVTDATALNKAIESLNAVIAQKSTVESGDAYKYATEDKKNGYDTALIKAEEVVGEANATADTVTTAQEALEDAQKALDGVTVKDDAESTITGLPNLNEDQKSALKGQLGDAVDNAGLNKIVTDATALNKAIESLNAVIAQKSTVESGDAYKYATEDKKNGYDTALTKAEEVVREANATAGTVTTAQEALEGAQKALDGKKPSYSGGGGGGGSYTPASKVTSDRIAGSNRFDTAVKVSQSAYPDGAKTVILANGEKFSDVLAAMPYGKTIKAPILYTNFDNIPDETLKELKRLGVEKVILVGGEKSISLDEQKTLEGKGYKIDRINGVDRYETSKLIAERMKAAGAKGINDVIIASGQVFPDALSISPLAVENEIPILLTSKDTLSEYTIKSLDNVKDGKIYITGGVNSVSNSVESKLKEYTKQKITRFAGADRYETSQIIAKSLRPNATTSVFASGELFSDALVAGELVSKDNAPLMLVKKNNLPSSISSYVKDSKITNNVIVGGVNTVSDSVVSKIEELENR
ncbi:cell wall-binding repeat-containing protein [Peptostreptococcus russellii]|uniref:cell wall-binding repeat-containing protein n=1 Tax=Peptostreptococcus russellii TaxID=215200 RepID=UPI002941D97A|nr:cell wall-binding repeat-containing protein [Peptostreptococcus russellii]